MMETQNLGNSDLAITRIGLGAWAIGGSWQWGWGSQEDQDSIATLHQALDAGINWIDTAPVYGLGHSETVIGQMLKERSNKPYIFTKCSFVWDDQQEINTTLKAASVRQEVEDSLQRLGVDVIDLYQIHWPNPEPEIEEGWETLAQLKQEGKVRYIGLSNFNPAQMDRLAAIAPITSLQPPYSLVKREVETEILPYCEQHNIGVIAYSPMGSGLLSGKMTQERMANLAEDDWRRKDNEFQEPRLSRNLELVEVLRTIGEKHGCGPAAVAIAWVCGNSAVTGAIVGMRRPDQVEGVMQAANLHLDPDDLSRIHDFLEQHP